MQDPVCGEIPKACVVYATVDPDALMAWVAERVAPYKRIRAVEVLDAIPTLAVRQDPAPAPAGRRRRAGLAAGQRITGHPAFR